MKFSQMIKTEKQELPVSRRHDAWMESNSNPAYSPEALEFARGALAMPPRNRKGTVSASSLNSCVRRQQFTFLGMPEANHSPKSSQILQNGQFMHLRWQMAGITEGWLVAPEVPIMQPNKWKLTGTMDGVLYNGFNLELKSINSNGFSQVRSFGVKDDHYSQVGTYMVVNDMEASSVIYEDKNTQEFTEIVVHRDATMERKVEASADRIWSAIDERSLAEPLATCEERTGFRFTGCPFRNVCLGIKNYDHAEELANG